MIINKSPVKKLLFFLSFFLAALFILSSCQKQPVLGDFGNTYTDDNTSAQVVVVDTATINVSTSFVDSTSTAGTGYLMVGSYNDDYLGKVSSRAYLQVAPPPSLPVIDPRIDTYDSIGMIFFFKPGSPYYGDTTQFQTYVVNQVDTLMELPPFFYGWYSNYNLPLGPDLGSTSVRIEPNRPVTVGSIASNTSQGTGDTVRIRLDDQLGQTIYNMVYNKSDTVKNATQWLKWFHGLSVSPAANTTANIVDGLLDTCIMRIYYRENALFSSEKFIDFAFTNKNNQYNYITTDRTGKPINNLRLATQPVQPPPLTPSGEIGHVGYVQSMEGLNVKLTFPYLNSIALRRDFIGLLRAQLTVRPVPGSFSTTWRLPPQVDIFTADQHNVLIAPVPAAGTGAAQSGNLVVDYFNPLNTAYTYDVTNFVAAQLVNPSPVAQQTGLMLTIPAPGGNASFNRLIVADQSYPVTQRITLDVYYISLFPHN
ncbi:MAG TPA: DUF4270 family protein [Puia sp.]|nr:DUF4270 family protein [Puia sp.]